MILYAITLKNMGKDANGLPNYVWATKHQIDVIGKLRNSPQQRYDFVEIGPHIFSPMDISHIERKDTENCGCPIPAYARNRYIEEKKKGILDNNNDNMRLLAK